MIFFRRRILPALLLLSLGASVTEHLPAAGGRKIVAKAILHENGNRTDSRRNPASKVLEEMTYNRRNQMVARKIFELDDAGRALRGLIFGADKKLVGRVQFGFDELGRMTEERTFDANGAVVRRLIYQYKVNGERRQAMVFHYGQGVSNPKGVVDPNARSTIVTPDVNGTKLGAGDQFQQSGGTVPTAPLTRRPGAR